jgi:putative endonuclease
MQMESIKKYFIYILSNKNLNVLYIGQTSDLKRRVYFHKKKLISGFSKKYNVDLLVYYEVYENAEMIAARERRLKKFSRERKIQLIEQMNRNWVDLYDKI